jgi:predicted RNase H-like HicB family nuclease
MGQAMKTKAYTALIERGPTSWGATVPDLPVILVVAKTREELEVRLKEAIEFHIEGLKEDGLPVPEPTTEAVHVAVAV